MMVKKRFSLYLVFLIVLFLTIIPVYAADNDSKTEKELTYNDLSDVSLKDNDYEISCTYSDGTNLVISRGDVVIANTSVSTSKSSTDIDFYFTDDQNNTMENGNNIVYRHDNILKNGHCPESLYLYKVEGKNRGKVKDDNTGKGGSSSDEDNESDLYFYSTSDELEKVIAGTHRGFLWIGEYGNADLLEDETVTLASEQAFVISTKKTLMCDYEAITQVGQTGEKVPLTIYLYKNMSFLEIGNLTTPLGEVLTDCPFASDSKKVIYVNDPSAKTVGSGGLAVTNNYYNSIRYSYSKSQSSCDSNNGGVNCMEFNYLGKRTSDKLLDGKERSVCEVVGNETVELIQTIMTILQILVPSLVIILTGVEIGKLIVAGNIDEVLPKRKKFIIIRFVIMILFFFGPLFSRIIITLLNDTGVVNIGKIDCIFK